MKFEQYEKVVETVNTYVNSFIINSRVSTTDYNDLQLFEQLTSELGVKVATYKFESPSLVGIFEANTQGQTIVTNSSRIGFADRNGKFHELGHAISKTLKENNQRYPFDNDFTLSDYCNSYIEQEANASALIFSVPDIVLFDHINTNNISFDMIHRSINVPSQVLERRIIRYLQINCMCSESDAHIITSKFKNKFRHENYSLLRDIINTEMFFEKVTNPFKKISTP